MRGKGRGRGKRKRAMVSFGVWKQGAGREGRLFSGGVIHRCQYERCVVYQRMSGRDVYVTLS